MLKNLIDPAERYYKTVKVLKEMKQKTLKVASIEPDKDDFDLESKGLVYDGPLQNFIAGAGGYISNWTAEQQTKTPLVIRGLGGTSQKALRHCMQTDREFYAIDTGYMQISGSKAKHYHRVTRNNLQNLGPIIDRPDDRLKKLQWKLTSAPNGTTILVCPPSEKVMGFYNKDLNEWTRTTLEQIKRHTGRPVEIRTKPTRFERVTDKTIWQALDDAYCLVTFNSIAATEAILYGVPAIALAPNAASIVCNTKISDIDKLEIPTDDDRIRFARHLSYCQFTIKEMESGYAWEILNESS